MGKFSRDKGARVERALIKLLQDKGFAAERVPLSGAMHGRFGSDISMPLLGKDLRVEVKCRANGFNRIYKWLEGSDAVILRADRSIPLLILPLSVAAEYALLLEKHK